MGLATQFKALGRNLFQTFSDFRDSATHRVSGGNDTTWNGTESYTDYTGIRVFRTGYDTPEEAELAGGADTKIIALAEDFSAIPSPDDLVKISSITYLILNVMEQPRVNTVVYVMDTKEQI